MSFSSCSNKRNNCIFINNSSHTIHRIVPSVLLDKLDERFKLKLKRFASQMNESLFNDIIDHLILVWNIDLGNVNFITVYKDIIFIIREHMHSVIHSADDFNTILNQIRNLLIMINCEYFPLMVKRDESADFEDFDIYLCKLLSRMLANLSARELDDCDIDTMYYIDDFMDEVIDKNVITFDNYMRVDYVQKIFTFPFCFDVIKCDIITSISDYVINVLHLKEFEGIDKLRAITHVQPNEAMADVILNDCDFSLSSLCEILKYYVLSGDVDDFYRGIRIALNDKQFTLLKTLISYHNAIYKTKIKAVSIQKHF